MSSDTTNATQQSTLWLKFGSLMVKCVIVVFCVISGWANVQTWTADKEGYDVFVFGAAGIGIEVFALFMLLFMERHLSARSIRSILKAVVAFILWGGAVYFSGTASWDYYVDRDTAQQQQNVREAEQLKLGVVQTRITELTAELEFIGLTRTPEEIKAERDRLPSNYKTKRAQLNSELAKAERRKTLDTELSDKRALLLGADNVPSMHDNSKQYDAVSSNSNIITILRDNHWAALVVFMEIVKALGFFLIRTEEARVPRVKKLRMKSSGNTAVKPQLVVSNEGVKSKELEDGQVEITVGGKVRRVKPV